MLDEFWWGDGEFSKQQHREELARYRALPLTPMSLNDYIDQEEKGQSLDDLMWEMLAKIAARPFLSEDLLTSINLSNREQAMRLIARMAYPAARARVEIEALAVARDADREDDKIAITVERSAAA